MKIKQKYFDALMNGIVRTVTIRTTDFKVHPVELIVAQEKNARMIGHDWAAVLESAVEQNQGKTLKDKWLCVVKTPVTLPTLGTLYPLLRLLTFVHKTKPIAVQLSGAYYYVIPLSPMDKVVTVVDVPGVIELRDYVDLLKQY